MKKKNRLAGVNEDGLQFIEITRSITQKLNMAEHGGKKFETFDIGCSVTKRISIAEKIMESRELDAFCLAEIKKTVSVIDGEAEEDEDEEEEEAPKKKTLDVGIKMEQKEIEAIEEYINDLTMAKNAKELGEAVKSIKDNSDDFTADEKKYLSAYYLKRKAALEAKSADRVEEEDEEEEDEEEDEDE